MPTGHVDLTESGRQEIERRRNPVGRAIDHGDLPGQFVRDPELLPVRQQEKAFHKKIPYAILFTRTNSALKPRTLQHIQNEFKKHGVKAFRVQIHEREAYRALFSFGGTLSSLNPQQVSNLEAAIINARAFAGEVIGMLRAAPQETAQVAEVA